MFEIKIKKIFILINLILIISGFFFLKNQTFSSIDNFFYSNLFNGYANNLNINGKNKIMLVKIDEKFFKKEGLTVSTFHRGYYAKLLEKLKQYEVKNIVFDVYFQDLKYGKGKTTAQKFYKKSIEYFDKKLEKYIDNKVVLGAIPIGRNGYKIEIPSKKFLKKGAWIGTVKSHLNNKKINDGVYPYGVYSGNKYLTLGYASYLNRLNYKENYKISINENKGIKKFFSLSYLNISFNNKKYKIPLSGKDNFILTPIFINKIDKKNSYSLYDIIHDDDLIYKDIFKGKTIFIGATDQTLNDIKLSYVGIIPGVLYHINNFLAINNNYFFYILPIGQSFLILLAIFIISHLFIIFFKNEKLTFLIYTIFILTLYVSSYFLFLQGILFPIGTIFIILIIKLIIDILHILFVSQEKKKFIATLFDKYVGQKIRTEKESKKSFEITTQKKEIALMFSDIANFTNISEKLKAEEVGQMLNIYFKICGKYIIESNGYVDKYIGDAIMAYWENIENTDNILKAIINIQKSHHLIIKKIENKIGKKINIQTRIGLHFGKAIVGDIGDTNTKIQPTAIGDNVNLASRLEGINKYYGTKIIISEDFYNKLENKESFIIRKIDKITVKGKTQAVSIYEAKIDTVGENDEIKKYIKTFEKGLIFYFQGDFIKAKTIFLELKQHKFGKNDTVLNVFIDRTNYLIKNKQKNWDGVWKYKTK